MAVSLVDISACSISLWLLRLVLPVNLRRRTARRRRMFCDEVSGRELKSRRKAGPANQRISQSDQCQFSFGTENPEMMGPRAGPPVAKRAHRHRAYGNLMRENMSPKLAPPVARHGEPKNPCRNRRNNRPPMLSTSAVGTLRMTNKANVAMYGGFRPILGISLNGAQSIGPRPYANT